MKKLLLSGLINFVYSYGSSITKFSVGEGVSVSEACSFLALAYSINKGFQDKFEGVTVELLAQLNGFEEKDFYAYVCNTNVNQLFDFVLVNESILTIHFNQADNLVRAYLNSKRSMVSSTSNA